MNRTTFTFGRAAAWALAMACLAVAGCTTTRTLSVAAGNSAGVERDPDGTTVLRSELKHTVIVRPIAARFSNELREMPSFAVMVANGGAEVVAFGPGDVRVTSEGVKVTVLSAEGTKQRMMQEMGLQRSGGLINVRDATQSGEPGYRYPDSSSSTSERLNVATMAVRDPNDPRQDNMVLPAMPVSSRLLSEVLRAQSIRPGGVGGGYLTLEASEIASGAPLQIQVTVAGETHTFRFDVSG
jgi:hypothetical protein